MSDWSAAGDFLGALAAPVRGAVEGFGGPVRVGPPDGAVADDGTDDAGADDADADGEADGFGAAANAVPPAVRARPAPTEAASSAARVREGLAPSGRVLGTDLGMAGHGPFPAC
ncbi:hypothetical protein [Streptomyces sp. NPDC086787]|uniref:hypothetical protein n=1 Tax=Streptomyces sp. NPDC086787 TaxID=3365759 RepID=UPI003813A88A